jgi:hypothetical protein
MRKLLFLLAFLFASGTAHANQSSPLTCWYNSSGAFTGADSGNPAGVPAAGQFQSYRTGDYAYAYRLDVWNDGNDCPRSINLTPAISSSINLILPPTFGYYKGHGDDDTISLTAGGPLRASETLSDCPGMIASASDVDYFLLAEGDVRAQRFILEFTSDSSADTTLLIRDPGGNWFCDDDSGGNLNPMLRLNGSQGGLYMIWVGTFEAANAPATLRIRVFDPVVSN